MAQSDLTLVGHLTDLRRRIIYVGIFFLVMLIASLVFVSNIYGYLVSPLTKEGYKLMVTSPGEVIGVYFSIAGIVAIGISLPFILYQTWLFVAPGLTPVERRYTLRLLPVSLVMFVVGVAFGWFVLFPTILHFLVRISQQQFTVMFQASNYFGFINSVCLPFGFIFELPIVVVFLTRIGVVTPHWLRKQRRYAYFVCAVVGVFISPPELISHLSVVIPMVLLYEISIALSVLAKRKRDRVLAALDL